MNIAPVPPTTAGDEYDEDICCQCGASVAVGSERFANRVPEKIGFMGRCQMGLPYPSGAYRCAQCERSPDLG